MQIVSILLNGEMFINIGVLGIYQKCKEKLAVSKRLPRKFSMLSLFISSPFPCPILGLCHCPDLGPCPCVTFLVPVLVLFPDPVPVLDLVPVLVPKLVTFLIPVLIPVLILDQSSCRSLVPVPLYFWSRSWSLFLVLSLSVGVWTSFLVMVLRNIPMVFLE